MSLYCKLVPGQHREIIQIFWFLFHCRVKVQKPEIWRCSRTIEQGGQMFTSSEKEDSNSYFVMEESSVIR